MWYTVLTDIKLACDSSITTADHSPAVPLPLLIYVFRHSNNMGTKLLKKYRSITAPTLISTFIMINVTFT